MLNIGVFANFLSEKSGGVYSLLLGLMQNAAYSENNYVFFNSPPQGLVFPPNVRVVSHPKYLRPLTKVFFHLPLLNSILDSEITSRGLLSCIAKIPMSTISSFDSWLWPHCFYPVPNLPNTIPICHDMIHSHYPHNFNAYTLLLRRRSQQSLHHCKAILTPSHSTANDLLKGYPHFKDKVAVFPEAPCEALPIDHCSAEIHQLETRFGKTPIFLFVGIDWPHKNHIVLIKAARELLAMKTRDFKIVFVGHRRTNSLRKAITESALTDFVIDLGTITRKELVAFYHISTALVFPSLYEGFGIPLVEAMQYGLPIVASNTSSIPEICGDAAVLLPPNSPELWAKEMNLMMANQSHRQRYSLLSRRKGATFTWERSWKAIDSSIRAALETNRAQT